MNMQNLMMQAQKMQREMQTKKEELDSMVFTGKSEWVEVEFYGSKIIKSVKILIDHDITSDDKEILEDMIQLAVKDAMIKINDESNKIFGKYSNGLNGLF